MAMAARTAVFPASLAGAVPALNAAFLKYCVQRTAVLIRMQIKSINMNSAAVSVKSAAVQSCNPTHSIAANQQPLLPPAGRALPHGLDAAMLPRHVAIYLDGHGRWRKERGVPTQAAFEASGKAWKEIVKVSAAWGISAFTTFFFSTENWSRPQAEVEDIFRAYTNLMHGVCEEFAEHNVQARAIGDVSCLPTSLQGALQKLEHRTKQNDGLKLSIGMNYGGRYDIVQACRRIVAKARSDDKLLLTDINEELLDEEMVTGWLAPPMRSPDLIIRPGGNQRLSNFLLWQTSYSELLFLDCLMPDMDEIVYAEALLTYCKRTRTFGGR
ncbi:hypothetical protein L7F22_050723 [Adiantum nelumboides]|nr:hypothetical protein [Adiantum nelumboides]